MDTVEIGNFVFQPSQHALILDNSEDHSSEQGRSRVPRRDQHIKQMVTDSQRVVHDLGQLIYAFYAKSQIYRANGSY